MCQCLCSAEPGWYSAESSSNSYKTLSYAALLAKKAKRDLRIPIILSGDSHHYARYVGDGSHYITSGGGGAFLHGTLELKEKIEARWLQSPKEVLNLQHCYPSKDESRKLLDASAAFGNSNPGLTWVLSAVYLLGAFLITATQRWEAVLLVGAVLFGGIWGYYGYQEGAWRKTALPAAYHGGAHFLVILAYSIAALGLNGILWPELSWNWLLWLAFLAAPLGFVGPTISGRIFGWSLRLGCLRYDISHNDAFSAMRLNSHRHFLRIKISGNSATIYAVKIESVPGRSGWIENPERAPKNGKSVFKPMYELTLGLIEPPIEVHAFAASSTGEIKKPDELASATASSQGKTV